MSICYFEKIKCTNGQNFAKRLLNSSKNILFLLIEASSSLRPLMTIKGTSSYWNYGDTVISVQIVRPDGSQVEGQFYYMNVLQRAYTIDVEKSPRGRWRDHNGNCLASIKMMPHLPRSRCHLPCRQSRQYASVAGGICKEEWERPRFLHARDGLHCFRRADGPDEEGKNL